MVVGAFARDHIVRDKAGLELGRTTRDLDLAVAVPSVREFVAMTSQLGKGGSTGMRFTVAGFPVDLIPFSALGDLEQPLELGDGVLMDTTGMDEAFRCAERDTQDFVGLRYPTLHAMIVLKTVAWAIRGAATVSDADDMALLLRCVDCGEYEDRCFSDLLGTEWADGDPRRVGAYLVGRDAARDLPNATRITVNTWRSTELRSACSGTAIAKLQPPIVEELLDALVRGAKSYFGSR